MYHKLATFLLITILAISNPSINVEANEVSTTLKNSSNSVNALAEKMTESPESLAGFGLIIKNKEGLSNKTTSTKLAGNLAKFQAVSNYKSGNKQTTMYSYGSLKELQEGLKTALLDPTVEIAQPNFKYHLLYNPSSNPKFNNTDQWYLQNGVGTMNAPIGWDAMQTRLGLSGCSDTGVNKQCGGLSSVKVAVIDSGVNTNIAEVPEFTNTNIDTANSVRFYTRNDNNCDSIGEFDTTLQDGLGNWVVYCKKIGSQFDEVGHGSIVAQQIVAGNNSAGGIGLGYNLTLLPIALHGGSLNTYYIAKAIEYATDQQVAAINLSLGSSEDSFGLVSSSLTRAIERGVIPVAASGNCGNESERDCFSDPALSPSLNPIIYPAAYNNTIAVGASNYGTVAANITKTSYSSFGSFLDFVAPVGGGSGTTTPNGIYGQCGKTYNTASPVDPNFTNPCNNKYLANSPSCSNANCGDSKWFGTSFAAPQIAALVGLMKSIDPSITFNGVLQIMKENSTDLGVAGFDNNTGWGIPKVDQIILNLWAGWNGQSGGRSINRISDQVVYSIDGRVYQNIIGNDTRLYTRSSADTLNWSAWVEGSGITLKDTPKLTEFNGKLYQAGFGTDNRLYTRNSTDGATWSNWVEGAGITLKETVEMVAFQNRLYQVGFGTDNRLYTRSSADGATWSNWVEGAGITLRNTPSVFVFQNNLYQSARGTDNRLYTRNSANGTIWTPWQEGAAITILDKPTNFVFLNSIYQSARGTDNRLYFRSTNNGTSWTNWTEGAGITILNSPDMFIANNRLFQATRGTDNKLYIRSTDFGTNWTNWTDSSGITTIVKPASLTLNDKVFQVTVGTDNGIWFRNRLASLVV